MKDYTGLCDSCYSGYVMIDSKCYPCNAVNAGEATGKYSDTDGDAYSRNYCLDCEKRADATDFAAKKYL